MLIPYRPTNTAVIALFGESLEQNYHMQRSLLPYTQSNFDIHVVYVGTNMGEFAHYKDISPKWWGFSFSSAGTPIALNQKIQALDHDLFFLLSGIPTDVDAIPETLSHMHPTAHYDVCGARIIHNRYRYHQSMIGYRYQNTNWDHRGIDNQILLSPHRTSAVSCAGMVLRRDTFLAAGLFDPAFLTYYAQDYCFRLQQTGGRILQLYRPTVEILVPLEDPEEAEALKLRYAGFVDPYGQYVLA